MSLARQSLLVDLVRPTDNKCRHASLSVRQLIEAAVQSLLHTLIATRCTNNSRSLMHQSARWSGTAVAKNSLLAKLYAPRPGLPGPKPSLDASKVTSALYTGSRKDLPFQ